MVWCTHTLKYRGTLPIPRAAETTGAELLWPAFGRAPLLPLPYDQAQIVRGIVPEQTLLFLFNVRTRLPEP